MCGRGKVLVNGSEAKPAKDVKQGDFITLKFPSRTIELEVLAVSLSLKKGSAENLYKIISETKPPREKDLWSEHLSS